MSAEPVQVEYARLAKIYDRRWARYIESSLQETLSRFRIAPGAAVLDLGCGTGTLLKYLTEHYPEIQLTGFDTSAEMLSVAQQKLQDSVQFQLGSAENLPFAANSFDFVVSTNAFHYFQDPARSLQEIRRVLKTQGYLVLTDWCRDYFSIALLDKWLRWVNSAHFQAYTKNDLQSLLTQHGFQIASLDHYKISWFWGLMTACAVKPNTESF